MKTTRKSFLEASLALATATACGGSDGGDDGGGNGAAAGCSESIASNHGHVLTVSQSDIDAAAEKTYDITGSADHPHQVTLSADDFAMLADGGTIGVTSSTDSGHSHDVTVMCA
jgi:hypothetical protein